MSRIARVVVPSIPHHVTQRGNGRQATFLSDSDRLVYLDLLRRFSRKHGLRLWAYCLMTNHVHLLALPEREDSLARALGRTHSEYARYWNARQSSCGHLWQARSHVTGRDDSGLLDMTFWDEAYGGARWLAVLQTSIDEEAWQQRLREATLRGRPLGSEEFIDGLESQIGHRLRPNPPGRPPKRKDVAAESPQQMSLAIGI
jgi:putative transposase